MSNVPVPSAGSCCGTRWAQSTPPGADQCAHTSAPAAPAVRKVGACSERVDLTLCPARCTSLPACSLPSDFLSSSLCKHSSLSHSSPPTLPAVADRPSARTASVAPPTLHLGAASPLDVLCRSNVQSGRPPPWTERRLRINEIPSPTEARSTWSSPIPSSSTIPPPAPLQGHSDHTG